ncbi:spore coat protein [Anaeromicrobium sediminis]|uniref:Spore coat protein n=1 Tax=Anaeromicrobium sediminis TaxID=1478221 RepID=A0A267MFU4_9FIRM|nr:spore coat protein [Anaeromicrobium sediminis]PAB58454.1 hypothetical protein CCE28_15205 [Anaeromicrobium sediminis]
MELSIKEKLLLEDQRDNEAVCVKTYTEYSNRADDSVLKNIFADHAKVEQEHYDTLTKILNGQVPPMAQGQKQDNKYQFKGIHTTGTDNDKYLCENVLVAEKYVSSNYDTAIFECGDHNIRQILNHIQKEEQEHGEHIYNYMQSRGMYNVQ